MLNSLFDATAKQDKEAEREENNCDITTVLFQKLCFSAHFLKSAENKKTPETNRREIAYVLPFLHCWVTLSRGGLRAAPGIFLALQGHADGGASPAPN